MLCRKTNLKVWVIGSPVGELLPSIPCYLSTLLMMPVQNVCGYSSKLCLDCSPCLSLALQVVSDFGGELDLDPAHDACPWLASL